MLEGFVTTPRDREPERRLAIVASIVWGSAGLVLGYMISGPAMPSAIANIGRADDRSTGPEASSQVACMAAAARAYRAVGRQSGSSSGHATAGWPRDQRQTARMPSFSAASDT